MVLRPAYAAAMLAMSVGVAEALTLAECDRATHAFHGGETAHVDLGVGRVMWQDWWSQEATLTTLRLVDCGPGAALSARTAESNLGDGLPFDRTDKALDIVARHESGSRVFATFERIAADLAPIARDITLTTLTAEPCACAALYPDARGEKTEFTLGG